jgi:hypothetical protein
MEGQRLAAIRLKVHPAALVMSCAADARPNAGKGLTIFGLKAIVGKILTVRYSRAWAFEDETTVPIESIVRYVSLRSASRPT